MNFNQHLLTETKGHLIIQPVLLQQPQPQPVSTLEPLLNSRGLHQGLSGSFYQGEGELPAEDLYFSRAQKASASFAVFVLRMHELIPRMLPGEPGA